MNGSCTATFNNPSVWLSSKQGLEGKASRCDSFTCNCFTLISCVGARVQGRILKQGSAEDQSSRRTPPARCSPSESSAPPCRWLIPLQCLSSCVLKFMTCCCRLLIPAVGSSCCKWPARSKAHWKWWKSVFHDRGQESDFTAPAAFLLPPATFCQLIPELTAWGCGPSSQVTVGTVVVVGGVW